VAAIAAIALLSTGCYVAPVVPPSGLLLTSVEAPLSTHVDGKPIGTRTGEASVTTILGIVSFGDASLEAAIRDGGIQEPRHADYRYLNVLGLYQQFTTIAYGD
jgi:hypothetical protein